MLMGKREKPKLTSWSQITTSRAESRYGRARTMTASATEETAVTAATPKAVPPAARKKKAGDFRSDRMAYRRSVQKGFMGIVLWVTLSHGIIGGGQEGEAGRRSQ